MSVLLNGGRYLVDSKYDAEFVSENGRVSMELNEVRLEQNIPFLADVGLPNKLETRSTQPLAHAKSLAPTSLLISTSTIMTRHSAPWALPRKIMFRRLAPIMLMLVPKSTSVTSTHAQI